MTQPAPVVVIGDALIDEIRTEQSVVELVGGAALNVAVGVRRLGHPTILIAMVGDDEAGDHIRQYLRDHDVILIDSPSERGTSRAVVQRDADGEPTYTFNDAAWNRSIRFGDAARAAIAQAPLVAVSCFPFDVAAEQAALAEVVGDTPLVIDPNPRAGMLHDRADFVAGFEQLAARATAVKIGADDAALLYDGDLEALGKKLRLQGARAVMMTAGADGAAVLTDAGRIQKPISRLPGAVVDTVGAGDATLAALAAGLVERHPETEDDWSAIVQRAMDVAAATVRGEGGLLRTPEQLARSVAGENGS
ncbi:carbohydrate kinase family protein [Microbacterium sp. YY-01]|uniref:carbohydrate kinase family protein n=1 Tax=Microbacterium sp. YY-01 TaxID=3421634 RepID=UPI003D16FFC7